MSNRPTPDMRVIVIGSGTAGASTAYHLARRGVDVTVVDAAWPGVATGVVGALVVAARDAELEALHRRGSG